MSEATTIDILWIVIAAALVMVMQGGFTLLETGMVRAKNSINVAIKNIVDFCIASGIYWVFGFAIMFGASSGGFFGTSGFFFGQQATPYLMAFFLFQMMFAGAATTIVSGAVAERMRFSSYVVMTVAIVSLIYPVVGHWVWAGIENGEAHGWLIKRGFIDFAGGTAVHSVGGWVALAAVLILGARKGRFEIEGEGFAANNLPQAVLGALILWFGWFGFNGGSTLRVSEDIPLIVLNTVLSGAFGGLAGLAASWGLTRKPLVGPVMNGALAGLVSITASAHLQTPATAVMIGFVGGIIAYGIETAMLQMKIDDAVGAFAVHGGGGIWGTLAVGLLGNEAMFGMSRGAQIGVQLLGIGVVFLYAFGFGYILLWTINKITPLRVSDEDEDVGLNVAEHGARTALATLLSEMAVQRNTGDLSLRMTVEPFTEVGDMAGAYNGVLNEIQGIVEQTQNENRELQQSIFGLLNDVTDIADGDLTVEATVTENATGAIADSFNLMTENLRDVIGRVQNAAFSLATSANEIQTSAEQLTEGSEVQASQIVDTTAAIDEMAVSIQQVSQNSALSEQVGEEARLNAERGGEAVRNTIEGMGRIRSQVQNTSKRIKRLGESTQEIGEMLLLIRTITKRTSILALNAAIQASRAGEAGQSFMVVAEEVEQLADRSASAAKQIEGLVQTIQMETNEAVAAMEATTHEVVVGSQLANEAGNRLNEIESVSSRLSELVQNISRAAQQQAKGSESIAASMNEIAQVTRQTSSGTREQTSSINTLAELADELRSAVSSFKIGEAQAA